MSAPSRLRALVGVNAGLSAGLKYGADQKLFEWQPAGGTVAAFNFAEVGIFRWQLTDQTTRIAYSRTESDVTFRRLIKLPIAAVAFNRQIALTCLRRLRSTNHVALFNRQGKVPPAHQI